VTPVRGRGITLVVVVAVILVLSGALAGCSGEKKQTLKVFNADSLMVPFEALAIEFEAEHPGVDVQIEGHGSIQVIRHATELHDEVDVLAVADYSLIPMLMYDIKVPDTDEDYADWYVIFATNELGLAYTPQSKYADEINSTNWYEVLSRPDVTVALSDPRFDSSGYRALMACQLAELYYGNETIFEDVLGNSSPPITVDALDGMYTITVPEVLKSPKLTIRGTSIALLSTIESGDVDYAFLYKSVAVQHGLEFLELPGEINLSSDSYKMLVQGLVVKLQFQRFASVYPEFECLPILYAVTIPQNTPKRELAVEFVKFLIGPEGQRILIEQNQPPIVPAKADSPALLPGELKPLVAE
jgi:molybdate/tungstate transport system substrate-binding protein